MKSRTGIVVSSGLIFAGVIIGVSVRRDHTVTQFVAVPVRVPTLAAAVDAPVPLAAVKPAENDVTAPSAPTAPTGYIARHGDTLSNVATGLFGTDSKANRATVVSANPSLQTNPDLILEGQQYNLTAKKPSDAPAAPTPAPSPILTAMPEPSAAPVLKYTATKGDTLTDLAGALLGGDTRANRDAIVEANPSLQANPDRLLAGKAYRIPAPDGLSAAAVPAPTVTARPATQPDADQLVHDDQTRTLRYTAKAGDTVSSLALVLLGSDTEANRNAIINTNASLKSDPDRVIEGKTYWIPAPVAAVSQGE